MGIFKDSYIEILDRQETVIIWYTSMWGIGMVLAVREFTRGLAYSKVGAAGKVDRLSTQYMRL